MSWKNAYKIGDLPPAQRIEITCKNCKKFRYVTVGHIQPCHAVQQQYLDEFEAYRICHVWGCGGECRIALPPMSDTEGFQGGLT